MNKKPVAGSAKLYKVRYSWQALMCLVLLLKCVTPISMRKIDWVKKRFVEEGLEVALNGEKRDRVYAKKVDGDFEAHLIALSCSDPPEGFARWSLRLLADKVVELGYIDNISHETVRRTLKKRNQTLAKEMMGNSPGTKLVLRQSSRIE